MCEKGSNGPIGPLEPAVNVHWYGALVVIWLVILADETCSEE